MKFDLVFYVMLVTDLRNLFDLRPRSRLNIFWLLFYIVLYKFIVVRFFFCNLFDNQTFVDDTNFGTFFNFNPECFDSECN